MFSRYRNPDLADRIFFYLLKSMATVQAADVHAFLLFVDNWNGHHLSSACVLRPLLARKMTYSKTNRTHPVSISCHGISPGLHRDTKS